MVVTWWIVAFLRRDRCFYSHLAGTFVSHGASPLLSQDEHPDCSGSGGETTPGAGSGATGRQQGYHQLLTGSGHAEVVVWLVHSTAKRGSWLVYYTDYRLD